MRSPPRNAPRLSLWAQEVFPPKRLRVEATETYSSKRDLLLQQKRPAPAKYTDLGLYYWSSEVKETYYFSN